MNWIIGIYDIFETFLSKLYITGDAVMGGKGKEETSPPKRCVLKDIAAGAKRGLGSLLVKGPLHVSTPKVKKTKASQAIVCYNRRYGHAQCKVCSTFQTTKVNRGMAFASMSF